MLQYTAANEIVIRSRVGFRKGRLWITRNFGEYEFSRKFISFLDKRNITIFEKLDFYYSDRPWIFTVLPDTTQNLLSNNRRSRRTNQLQSVIEWVNEWVSQWVNQSVNDSVIHYPTFLQNVDNQTLQYSFRWRTYINSGLKKRNGTVESHLPSTRTFWH